MKIRPVGAELFIWTDRQTHGQKDRQTDMTKLIVTFCNFANMSKNMNDMTYFIKLIVTAIKKYVQCV
jgi:hypothetical protein